jgi:hypothetical protein
MAGEPPMQNHEVTLCDRQCVFVARRVGQLSGQFKQTFATLCDVGTMLNVVRRPERLSGRVVSLVEERVKRFQYKCLVFAALS